MAKTITVEDADLNTLVNAIDTVETIYQGWLTSLLANAAERDLAQLRVESLQRLRGAVTA